ncbi:MULTISPECIES: hypothetical protein [Phyllobacteriaceae]|uniref:hypothetical protein n=1 Tax=Phyllobacteriaceae TaxID=69277 RepID=UPI002ACA6443|nr:hypothetical protein [Chelativorans sp. M5D2P16]MDZ5698773.1 hypothetical protein [Chelativorans sp. M5D2P16]
MNMHYKADSISVPYKESWWRSFGHGVARFFRQMSNRENIVMGAPWPAPSRRRK